MTFYTFRTDIENGRCGTSHWILPFELMIQHFDQDKLTKVQRRNNWKKVKQWCPHLSTRSKRSVPDYNCSLANTTSPSSMNCSSVPMLFVWWEEELGFALLSCIWFFFLLSLSVELEEEQSQAPESELIIRFRKEANIHFDDPHISYICRI